MRFQDEEEGENLCNVMNDYSLGHIVRNAKIRRVEGKSPEEFDHFHVGGTTLCADYARRALIKATQLASNCDRVQKMCKYSTNYPAPSIKSSRRNYAHSKCSSIYV